MLLEWNPTRLDESVQAVPQSNIHIVYNSKRKDLQLILQESGCLGSNTFHYYVNDIKTKDVLLGMDIKAILNFFLTRCDQKWRPNIQIIKNKIKGLI